MIQKIFWYFEKEMGFKPKGYSYPYGEYDDRVKNVNKSLILSILQNQNNGSVNEKVMILI